MNERFINELTELVRTIAREVARKVFVEELPKILDNLSKPGSMLSDLVDYNKASEMLGVSKPTLHSYIRAGKLTKHCLVEGGKPFLKLSEIEKMIKKNRRVDLSLN